jgi:hypothetical protein
VTSGGGREAPSSRSSQARIAARSVPDVATSASAGVAGAAGGASGVAIGGSWPGRAAEERPSSEPPHAATIMAAKTARTTVNLTRKSLGTCRGRVRAGRGVDGSSAYS